MKEEEFFRKRRLELHNGEIHDVDSKTSDIYFKLDCIEAQLKRIADMLEKLYAKN